MTSLGRLSARFLMLAIAMSGWFAAMAIMGWTMALIFLLKNRKDLIKLQSFPKKDFGFH